MFSPSLISSLEVVNAMMMGSGAAPAVILLPPLPPHPVKTSKQLIRIRLIYFLIGWDGDG